MAEKQILKTALSIAGSDSSGGAGIQADIKTIMANGVYAMTAITALTAQNTMGVKAISEVSPDFLKEQINAVFEDIVPDAVKIGMLPSREQVLAVSERLKFYKAKNIVLDPVMTATSGENLAKTEAVHTLTKELFPLSTLVTPNIPEAEILSGIKITNKSDVTRAAKIIGDNYSCSVLLKGGHGVDTANDILYSEGIFTEFEGKRINNPNTHGTGCTLSSAIAANLAKGMDLISAVKRAKAYISAALSAMLDLGQGFGPLNHGYFIND